MSQTYLESSDFARFLSSNRDDGETLWVFHHIPKTAGSSFATELGGRLKPRHNIGLAPEIRQRTDLTHEEKRDLAFENFLLRHKTSPVRFTHGHLRRRHIEALRALPQKVRIVTVLREPFARIVSSYRYMQTVMNPDHEEFCQQFPTFESYIEDVGSQNIMFKFICGSTDPADLGHCKSILEHEYTFCGLLERYPLSFRVVGQLLGFRGLPEEHKRKTPSSVTNEVRDAESYSRRVRELNRLDYAIYQMVKAKLTQDRAAIVEYLSAISSGRESLGETHAGI